MPITIPADDPIFGNFSGGVLKFTRSERARVDFLGLFGSGSPKLATQIPKVIAKDPDLGKSPGVAKALPGTRGSPSTVGLGPSQARVRQGKIKINPDSPIKPSEPGPNEAPSPGRFQFYLRNERPVNSLTSAVDLSSVYGVDNRRNDALRSKIGGKLLTSGADFLPLNNPMLSNAPTSEKIYFLAGDHRSNEHPMLTTFHTIFVREHNSICDELKASFPTWSDQMLYENARRINSAQFQKIVFEEFYPAMTGRNLSPYSGFKFYRNVNIIDIFSTAAFRVGHTMIGNKVSRRGPGNAPLPGLNMEDMFFRVASKLMPGDMENFLRGAMQTNAQEVDLMVHDALRDFLFTGIPEEGVAIDLISLNIQRGRDHALPTLNQIRARLGITPASSFSDISSNLNTQLRLASVYSNVNQVEAWPGMVAEDHVSGSSMGKTMLAVWDRQFLNLRDGDRFFYKNIVFDASLKAAVPRINRISTAPELLREIILRNTDVAAGELPPQIFFKR